MKTYLKIFFSVIFITALAPVSAPAEKAPVPSSYYNYARDEAEYSVMLPEAPTVRTIWEESSETTPYMVDPPTDSAALGEVAVFKRVDIDTEELFDARITFLKAKHSVLAGLTPDIIKALLEKRYKMTPLSNEEFTVSAGKGTLKWATLRGFGLDTRHHPAFSAIHYLTGQQSILVVQVTYSIENKTYQDYYNNLVNSITYNPP